MTEQKKTPKKPLIFYYIIAMLVLLLLNALLFPTLLGNQVKQVDYGTFLAKIDADQVKDCLLYTSNRTALGILVGILVALPVGLLFIALFSSADANFSSLFGRTFQFIAQNIGFIVTDVFFGLVIALFCAALFIGLKGRQGEGTSQKDTQGAPIRLSLIHICFSSLLR